MLAISLIGTMLESNCVAIIRPSIGVDSSHGTTQTWTVPPATYIQQNIPCSQQEASAHIKALYAQQNAEVPTTLFFAQDPGCEPNDLIQVKDRTGATTNYLSQGQAQTGGGGRGRLWTVDAIRIRQPGG